VEANVVMLSAKCVQPWLQFAGQCSATIQSALQGAVKVLHLALRLRMADAAPVEPNALAHEPKWEVGSVRGRLGAPPGSALVHEHSLGQAAAIEGFD
jgi:hypothetical protein